MDQTLLHPLKVIGDRLRQALITSSATTLLLAWLAQRNIHWECVRRGTAEFSVQTVSEDIVGTVPSSVVNAQPPASTSCSALSTSSRSL